jgi:hypothetical protein
MLAGTNPRHDQLYRSDLNLALDLALDMGLDMGLMGLSHVDRYSNFTSPGSFLGSSLKFSGK